MKFKRSFRFLGMVFILSVFIFLNSQGVNALTSVDQKFLAVTPYHQLISELHDLNTKGTINTFQQYIPHQPIVITTDYDFVTFGFPGDGSQSDPYFIEGLNITSSTTDLLTIKSTTAYFHIQNNLLNGLNGESDGIKLHHVTHGTIDTNIITNCDAGISLSWSESNLLFNNTVANSSWNGIHLESSQNNILSKNIVANNTYAGISLDSSRHNTLLGNSLINNGLDISGGRVEDCLQATVAENMINGRPLVYWQNVIGGTIPPGAGQVILINTTRVEVTGQDLSWIGVDSTSVLAVFSSNLDIHHNTISRDGHGRGIYLVLSKNITVTHNFISKSGTGIDLSRSGQNTVVYNTLTNIGLGINLCGSGYGQNTIAYNIIANNGLGIFVTGVENNMVKWNDFLGINNIPDYSSKACDFGTNNIFAYNYWGDHNFTDLDGDGIADDPYSIDGSAANQDLTPLMAFANHDADTDEDGLPDVEEIDSYGTNPMFTDTDRDGLVDGEEVIVYKTDPLVADSDGDTYSDGEEVIAGFDPNDPAEYPSLPLSTSLPFPPPIDTIEPPTFFIPGFNLVEGVLALTCLVILARRITKR